MNYENPLGSTDETDQPRELKALDYALGGGLLLGGGLGASALYKRGKSAVNATKQAVGDTIAAAETTAPGRVAVNVSEAVLGAPSAAKKAIKERADALHAFEKDLRENSLIGQLTQNPNLLNERLKKSTTGVLNGFKHKGKKIAPEEIQGLLQEVAGIAASPRNLYGFNPQKLPTAAQAELNALFGSRNFSQADQLATALYAQRLGKRLGEDVPINSAILDPMLAFLGSRS